MEAPKRIYYTFEVLTSATGNHPQACHYIRADLVDKLKEYAVGCAHMMSKEDQDGLTEVLKEME